MQQPQPDPGETYPHVNTQLFGIIDPPTNAQLLQHPMSAPFNNPQPEQIPTNSGFVHDYIVNYRLAKRQEPTPESTGSRWAASAEMLPVLSTLAREFAVYDNWFAAVPSQTFCNRSFFHASTSHGYVTNHNGDYEKWINAPAAPTIFNRLEEAGIPWRVYYDPTQLVSMTGMLHASVLRRYWKTNFRDMTQFYDDVENGNLPAYAFIEPRMIFNHNDMHPPWGELRDGEVTLDDGSTLQLDNSAYSDVRAGDKLLQDIYDAIRTSTSAQGSNAMNTALVVTFDEHGGTFDHVPPPTATPPTTGDEGEMGFAFDRLGVRVPAIVVSAYTAAGTVIHDEMHHGAVISTLCRQHGLEALERAGCRSEPHLQRDQPAAPRQPYTWPRPTSLWKPPNPEAVAEHTTKTHKKRPLTSPARGLLGLLMSQFDRDAHPRDLRRGVRGAHGTAPAFRHARLIPPGATRRLRCSCDRTRTTVPRTLRHRRVRDPQGRQGEGAEAARQARHLLRRRRARLRDAAVHRGCRGRGPARPGELPLHPAAGSRCSAKRSPRRRCATRASRSPRRR
jgi:phospholipase C